MGNKGKVTIFQLQRWRAAHLAFCGHETLVEMPLLPDTGWCDARSTVTFPAYSAWWQRLVCMNTLPRVARESAVARCKSWPVGFKCSAL